MQLFAPNSIIELRLCGLRVRSSEPATILPFCTLQPLDFGLWTLDCGLFEVCHRCHRCVTGLSPLQSHKTLVFIGLSPCHRSRGILAPHLPLGTPFFKSVSINLHPATFGLPRLATGLPRLCHGSKLIKGLSLLLRHAVTGPGGYIHPLPLRLLLFSSSDF